MKLNKWNFRRGTRAFTCWRRVYCLVATHDELTLAVSPKTSPHSNNNNTLLVWLRFYIIFSWIFNILVLSTVWRARELSSMNFPFFFRTRRLYGCWCYRLSEFHQKVVHVRDSASDSNWERIKPCLRLIRNLPDKIDTTIESHDESFDRNSWDIAKLINRVHGDCALGVSNLPKNSFKLKTGRNLLVQRLLHFTVHFTALPDDSLEFNLPEKLFVPVSLSPRYFLLLWNVSIEWRIQLDDESNCLAFSTAVVSQ